VLNDNWKSILQSCNSAKNPRSSKRVDIDEVIKEANDLLNKIHSLEVSLNACLNAGRIYSVLVHTCTCKLLLLFLKHSFFEILNVVAQINDLCIMIFQLATDGCLIFVSSLHVWGWHCFPRRLWLCVEHPTCGWRVGPFISDPSLPYNRLLVSFFHVAPKRYNRWTLERESKYVFLASSCIPILSISSSLTCQPPTHS